MKRSATNSKLEASYRAVTSSSPAWYAMGLMKKQRDSASTSAAEGVFKIGAGLIPALRLTDAKEVKGEEGSNAWPSPPPA